MYNSHLHPLERLISAVPDAAALATHALPRLAATCQIGIGARARQSARGYPLPRSIAALRNLGQVLSVRFIHSEGSDTAEIFRVYAQNHVLSSDDDQI